MRGRPFVAGGAVAAAWLIAGAVPLVAVMPGATPTWALVVLGVAPVVGLTLATLDLLAATSRAWGPGALAGLGRTLAVGVLAAAAGAAAGILVGRWWVVEGPWANAGVAVALAVLGAAVTGGVLRRGRPRDRRAAVGRAPAERSRRRVAATVGSHAVGPDVPDPTCP